MEGSDAMTEKQKPPALVVKKGGMTFEMAEVGSFSWTENEDGSIVLTAAPPGVTPAPAAGRRGFAGSRQAAPSSEAVAGLLKKGADAIGPALAARRERDRDLPPGLAAKSDELAGKASASAARAREAAAEEEAARNQARGRDPESPADTNAADA